MATDLAPNQHPQLYEYMCVVFYIIIGWIFGLRICWLGGFEGSLGSTWFGQREQVSCGNVRIGTCFSCAVLYIWQQTHLLLSQPLSPLLFLLLFPHPITEHPPPLLVQVIIQILLCSIACLLVSAHSHPTASSSVRGWGRFGGGVGVTGVTAGFFLGVAE